MLSRLILFQWAALIVLSLGAASPCAAGPEFLGVLTSGGQLHFALRDEDAKAFAWTTMGSSVGAYTISSYDSKTETLSLRREGAVITLKLRDGVVEPAPTVALVAQLAGKGDTLLRSLLPELQTLETRRTKTARELADLETRALTDPQLGDRVAQYRRKLQIEEANLAFFLQKVVLKASSRSAAAP